MLLSTFYLDDSLSLKRSQAVGECLSAHLFPACVQKRLPSHGAAAV